MSRHWSERQWRMMTDERMALIERVAKQANGGDLLLRRDLVEQLGQHGSVASVMSHRMV
jgi:hypothetical protein